jgi:hypothetical protein
MNATIGGTDATQKLGDLQDIREQIIREQNGQP